MIDLSGVTHHRAIEEIVEVLCNRTQNTDKGFFRTVVAYFLAKMASCQRAYVATKDRGNIPVNIYATCLATSGYGKGYSVSTIEDEFLKGFRQRFMNETLTVISDQNFWKLANERAVRNNTNDDEEYEKIQKEYKAAGAFAFTFDSGTAPAVKQFRQKLLLANCGAISFQVDEIGSNLEGNLELMTLFLELYDQGRVKQKLTKNTNENIRAEEVDGKTPSNMLLFGTPSKLFDGSKVEDLFYSLLETGYARRSLFGHGSQEKKSRHVKTPREIYLGLINPTNHASVAKWSDIFHTLGGPDRYAWKMVMEDDVAIKLMEYKVNCEIAAEAMKDFQAIQRSEMEHRFFKALKLAGAYAFVDGSPEIEMDHILQAILLVEESGKSFEKILTREKNHVRLGKYLAAVGTEVTHHDLLEALPFYPKTNAVRNDMISLATAWGYKNNTIIKKTWVDGIEFFRGESIKETNLDEMILSYSAHWAYNYEPVEVPFDQLHQLTQEPDLHWANHHFRNKHRAEENIIPRFNMLVLDVDGGVPISLVHKLLKKFKFMTYTTKRHTDEQNRFRLILPINYVLELDKADYKEFVTDVVNWLPFSTGGIDGASGSRCHKWQTCDKGTYHYNLDADLLDVLPFIPKTRKNEDYRQNFKSIASFDNLERWFAQQMGEEGSGRNNLMIKYALSLVDSGLSLPEVMTRVKTFDSRLQAPLGEDELSRTIFKTVASRYENKVS